MSNKVYDFLKASLPYLAFLAFIISGFGDVWGIPYADKIASSITLIITGITTYIVVDSKKYWKDKEIVDKNVVDYNIEDKG